MSRMAEYGRHNSSGPQRVTEWEEARHSNLSSSRMATTRGLMPRGSGLIIPRLDGVPREHQIWQGEKTAARIAMTFLKGGLASEADWRRAHGNPFEFLSKSLNRWVASHGAKEIEDEFKLNVMLSTSLDRYFFNREIDSASELFLTVEPESAGYIVLGPTLRFLETVHPRLPVTFANMFIGTLNRWIRVYDWRDAQERVEAFRECYEMDPLEDGEVELPDIESSIPDYTKRRPLARKTVERMLPTIKNANVRLLLTAVVELDRLSSRVIRPTIDEDTGAMLADCGDPLPTLLAVFEKHDAIEGQFDEESQGMLEITPEPNLIIRMEGEDVESVRKGFDALATCFETLACAVRTMKIMPGNEHPD